MDILSQLWRQEEDNKFVIKENNEDTRKRRSMCIYSTVFLILFHCRIIFSISLT